MPRYQLKTALTVLATTFLAAACGDPPGSPAATEPTSADCEAVPFTDAAAMQRPVLNWGLRYRSACHRLLEAMQGCGRLVGVSELEKVDCMRENIDLDEQCPEGPREALRDVIDDLRIAQQCRDVEAARAEENARDVAGGFDDIPADIAERTVSTCVRRFPFDSTEAGLCVQDALDRYEYNRLLEEAAEAERERAEAERRARVAALDAGLAAALDEHADAWPAGRRDDVADHCRSGDGPATAECVTEAAGLFRAAGEAVSGVPEVHRGPILDACVKSRKTAHRGLGIADPECAAEDAGALAALGRGYADDVIDACRTAKRRRWSQVFACVRRAWITRERLEVAVARELSEATAGLGNGILRPVVTKRCAWTVPRRVDSFRAKPWLEFEHPADGIARLAGSCVERETSALLGIQRAAGTTYAAAFERCARHAPRLMGNQHWPYVASCVGDAAREAGGTRFADALRACAKSGEAADMAACSASADG